MAPSVCQAGGAFLSIIMPWITFTADHVKARLSARELETYEDVSRAEYGEDDEEPSVPPDAPERMPAILEQVCNRFRGAIRSNPRVSVLGPAGTLPDFVIFSAAVIARDSLIALPPIEEGMTNPRQKEHDAAEAELKWLRTADPKVFADDEAAASSNGGAFGGQPLLDF